MALVVADRVWETTSTSGTGTLTLSGAVSGYQTFAVIGDGNTTYYTITNGTDWEVGIGTYTSSGTTLSRDTVLSSSLGGTTKITVTPGSFVFVDYPASRAVYKDASGIVTGYPISGGTINGTTIGATTPATGKFSTLESTGTGSFGTTSAQYIQAVGNALYPQILAVGSGTNIPLVLQPKGTGALQAQLTDSTATGGNARGARAVDWQTERDIASRVASATSSVVSGGSFNTASSQFGLVAGGGVNTTSGFAGVVSGGYNNTASGIYAGVGGGQTNTASGYYGFVGNGFTNSTTSNSAVTTQSGTMNATTAVTLSGSNANIKVGQYITGTSIAGDTYVAAISGTSLTLSKVASGSSTSTLSFFTPHGVVVGGGNNQATGSYSFIGGGGDAGTAANRNSVASDWGVAVGGFKNTVSATGIANTIGGGYGNTISGGNHGSVIAGGGTYNGTSNPNTITSSAAVISGGILNNNSSFVGFIGGGFNNTANGSNYSTIVGGQGNTANSSYSFISAGLSGTTRGVIGNHVFPACAEPISGVQGVSQTALLVLGVQTTDATATALRSNTSAAGTTNQVILPNNSAYFFRGEVISGVTGGGNTKGWTIEGVIKRGANAASTALVGVPTVTSTYADAGASTWDIAVTADTTNGGLRVTFTGQAATTIRTVAQIRTTEMTF